MTIREARLIQALRELNENYRATLTIAYITIAVSTFAIGMAKWSAQGSIFDATATIVKIQALILLAVFARYISSFKALSQHEKAVSVLRSLSLGCVLVSCATIAFAYVLREGAPSKPVFFSLIAIQVFPAWLGSYGIYWLAARWAPQNPTP